MVENWAETLWKSATVRLSAFWGLLIAYFMAYPDQWDAVQEMIPESWRPIARICVGFAIFASMGGARVVAQKSMAKPADRPTPEEPQP